MPGKSLATSDAQRDVFLKEMTQVAAKSGAAIAPSESQHVTLWAPKDMQETYLADLQKAEKFFHTKCGEPIRSGLDKRSTHIILLKDHAEYEAWWRAMLDLFGKQFEEKGNPGGNEQFRQQVLRGPLFHGDWFSVVSLAEMHPVWVHHNVAFSADINTWHNWPRAGPPHCKWDSAIGRKPPCTEPPCSWAAKSPMEEKGRTSLYPWRIGA